jgi:hypothetical protein
MEHEDVRIYITVPISVFPSFRKIVHIRICFAFSIFKTPNLKNLRVARALCKAQAPEKEIVMIEHIKKESGLC